MTTASFAALQKQVRLLTNKKVLSMLHLSLLEIALEGMNVPRSRINATIAEMVEVSRANVEKFKAERRGGPDAP